MDKTLSTIKSTAKRESHAWMVAVLVLAFGIGWQWFWNADRYYSITSVKVADTDAGKPIFIEAERDIKLPFQGAYTVTVRDTATFQVICSGGASVNYRPGSTLPDPVTLDWWAAGAVPHCKTSLANAAPGRFIMETCVEVRHAVPFTPRDSVCNYSNIFRVY